MLSKFHKKDDWAACSPSGPELGGKGDFVTRWPSEMINGMAHGPPLDAERSRSAKDGGGKKEA